jgi:hypothetical protein
MSLTQLAMAFTALGVIIAGRLWLAGLAVAVGAAASTLSAWRADRPPWARGAFLGEAADRVFDAAILGSVAWAFVDSDRRLFGVALAALGAGGVVAYVRARGRGLGYRVPRWPAYRAGRGALIALGLMTEVPEPFLWAVIALDIVVGAAWWGIVARQGTPV